MKNIITSLLLLCMLQINAQTEPAVINMTDNTTERTFLASPALGNVEPELFEVNLTPHKYFYLKRSRILMNADFNIILRMLHLRSCPIRTPDYKPSVSFQKMFAIRPDSSRLYWKIVLGHHSNGQDGSFYDVESGKTNLVDGNFSTNYLNGGVVLESRRGNFFNLGLEQHLNIDRCKELNNRYGFTRLHADIQTRDIALVRWFKRVKENNFVRVGLNNTWILDRICGVKSGDASKRMITSVILTYKPAAVKDLSVFVQAFRGEDYYNIHFDHNIAFIRFGISLEPNSIREFAQKI